ncbi:MAG: hypothetical protein ACOVRM_04235, partial [Planctomycetaceae bacterium]
MAVVAVLLQDGFDGAAEILVFCVIGAAGIRQCRADEEAREQESEAGAVGHGGGVGAGGVGWRQEQHTAALYGSQ